MSAAEVAPATAVTESVVKHEDAVSDEAALSGGEQASGDAKGSDMKQNAKGSKKEAAKATPKKRAAAKDADESPKKKRSPVKAKKATKANEADGEAADEEVPPTPPETPSPKKARGKKAATATANNDDANVESSAKKAKGGKKGKAAATETETVDEESGEITNSQESATTKTGTPRKRAAAANVKAAPRGLPSSLAEASEADRMLLHMKDEGKPWSEIRATWKVLTGQETASSTLPNRYNRIKANFMELKEADAPRLLSAKSEIDTEFDLYVAKFNSEKWAKVQKAMEAKGTVEKYPALFLQKKFEDLSTAANKEEKEGSAGTDGKGKEGEVGGGGKDGNDGGEEGKEDAEMAHADADEGDAKDGDALKAETEVEEGI